ncbi:MAG: hypothetical protein ACJA2W_000359 [Planctomycetota bacterium]|jgi:uncharacterized protein (DUF2132 family)
MTLKAVLEDLIERRGFESLAEEIQINCFAYEPSLTSSLRFLRKVDWARRQVEELYIADHDAIARQNGREL